MFWNVRRNSKLHTYLTQHSTILLEKLIVAELVKKFSTFHVTLILITVFAGYHHTWCILWHFITYHILHWVVSPLSISQALGPPVVGCPRLLTQYIRSALHIWRSTSPFITWEPAMLWWQRSLKVTFKHNLSRLRLERYCCHVIRILIPSRLLLKYLSIKEKKAIISWYLYCEILFYSTAGCSTIRAENSRCT